MPHMILGTMHELGPQWGGGVVLMLAAVAGLAAMGLVFCWCCSDRLHDVGGVASRWCFKRQVVWNIAGVP